MANVTGRRTINNIKVLEIDSSPTVGSGVTAALGSIASVNDGYGLFFKSGTGDTHWTYVNPSAGGNADGYNYAIQYNDSGTFRGADNTFYDDGTLGGTPGNYSGLLVGDITYAGPYVGTWSFSNGRVEIYGEGDVADDFADMSIFNRGATTTNQIGMYAYGNAYDGGGASTYNNAVELYMVPAATGASYITAFSGGDLVLRRGFGTREWMRASTSQTIFNATSADLDHVFRGDTEANLLFIDAGTDRVGIGTATPAAVLSVVSGTLASGERALEVSGTLPAVTASYGAFIGATGTGSAAGEYYGAIFGLNPGYTGGGTTYGTQTYNNSAGAGANPFDVLNFHAPGNYGISGTVAASTTGTNVGVVGNAASSSGRNIGILGRAFDTATTGSMTGVAGATIVTSGVTNRAGGLFFLIDNFAGYNPTVTTAALLIDNGNVAAPVFIARDEGTDVFTINDGGSVNLLNIAAPATPASGYGRLYANTADKKLYWKDDAGVAYDLTSAGTLSGSGVANSIAYWASSTTLTSSNNFVFSGNDMILGGNLLPAVNDGYTLGSPSLRWKDGYFGPESLFVGVTGNEYKISFDTVSPGTLQFNPDKQNKDLTISGDTDGYLIMVDASLDAVGIGAVAESGFKLKVTGKLKVTDQILAADGTAAAPSIAWASDADASGTGFYRSAANEIAAVTNGTARFTLTTNTATFGVEVQQTAGSAGSPSLTYTSDTDTGIFRAVSNTLGFTTGGTQRLELSTTTATISLPTVIAPPVVTSGTAKLLTITGAAHTGLTASTENVDVDFALNRTVEFATGALALQRAAIFRRPTYGFVGASTITSAATVYIENAPGAGANATISNAYALWVDDGNVRFDGDVIGSGRVSAGNGTVAAPSFTLAGSLSAGFYQKSINVIGIATNGAERGSVGNTEVVWNDPGNDVDFRVEGDSDGYLFMADAGLDAIGIGTGTPTNKLEILTISASQQTQITLRNTASGANSTATSGIRFVATATTGDGYESAMILAGKEQSWTGTASTQDGYIAFYTAKDGYVSEASRITSDKTLVHGGGITFSTGQILAPNGSATIPSYSFTNDADSGLFWTATQPMMSVGGVVRQAWTGAGILINAAVNDYDLEVRGGGGTFIMADSGLATVTINNTGVNMDFIVRGDNDSNLIFSDASADRVGIGTGAPSNKLEVLTTSAVQQTQITLRNTTADANATATSGIRFIATATTGDGYESAMILAGKEQSWTGAAATQDGYLAFYTARDGYISEAARITSDKSLVMSGAILLPPGSASAPALAFAADSDTGIWQNNPGGFSMYANGAARFEVGNELTGSVNYRGPNGSVSSPSYGFANDADTGLYLTASASNTLAITTNGFQRATLSATEFAVNDVGNDYDFRIEGDNDGYLFATDGYNDKVGIGRGPDTLTAKLDIDNGTNSFDVFRARDNGTEVFAILDGGQTWHKTHTSAQGDGIREFTGGVQTTDGTTTVVTGSTFTLSDNTVYWIEATVSARETGGTDRAVFKTLACVYRQGAGIATLQGAPIDVVTPIKTAGATTWTATLTVSGGNDVRVSVTGVIATTINWTCTVCLQGVS